MAGAVTSLEQNPLFPVPRFALLGQPGRPRTGHLRFSGQDHSSCFSRAHSSTTSDRATIHEYSRRRDRNHNSGSNPERATRRTWSELPLRILVFCAGECPPESSDLWPATSSRHADPPVYSSTLRSLLRVLKASRTRSRHGVSGARRRGDSC